VLAVAMVAAMGVESMWRANKRKWFEISFNRYTALGLCGAHLGLVSGMAAVFFGDEQAEGWAGAAVALALIGIPMLLACGGYLYAAIRDTHASLVPRICTMICALVCVVLILPGMGYAFFTAEHMDNNYANKSMPMGGPGSGSGPDDPQYFDCHERTSGLYPAYLATALCVVLSPLYAALEPRYGIGCMRGKSLQQKNEEAEAKLRAEVIAKAGAVSLEEQAETLWEWAGQTHNGSLCIPEPIPAALIGRVAEAAGMEFGALCKLLEIKETKLSDEPLLEGSTVRYGPRLGTVCWRRVESSDVDIFFADDSRERRVEADRHCVEADRLQVVRLETCVGREALAAACTQHPERTAKMHTEVKVQQALLEAKIEAVWRWADTVADSDLGTTELRRLASRVGIAQTNDPKAEDQEKYEDMCKRLGLDAADREVSIDQDAFTAACRARPGVTVGLVEWGWFDNLALLLSDS
jgi:hypothetical protein